MMTKYFVLVILTLMLGVSNKTNPKPTVDKVEKIEYPVGSFEYEQKKTI